MTELDLPECEGFRCWRCGQELEFYYPTHGHRYWTCPGQHSPPVIMMGPEIVDWAFAFVLPIHQFGEPKLSELDPDASDPLRPVDRLCERYGVVEESVRENELERRSELADQKSATDDTQASLRGWSA